ncbi:EAL domain-containing protein [Cohnella sp.]|uniref:EAL domain-containing protein n=1 Tax=Cohnella sp. TaxID=1883426 RepID=UPI0035672DF3
MNKINGWLNPEAMKSLMEKRSLRGSGLFIVQWEQGLESSDRRAGEPLPLPLRIHRLLQTVVLRFSQVSHCVVGFTPTASGIIMIVSINEDEDADKEAAELAAGRFSFLLRDLSVKIFTYSRLRRLAVVGNIRCGFGWVVRPWERDRNPISDKGWEMAIVRATESAWKQMLDSGSQIVRLPLPEAPLIRSDNEITVKYAPILSLLDGSLYGFEAIPYTSYHDVKLDLDTFYASADQSGKLFDADRCFREAAIRGFPSKTGDVKLFLPVPAKIIYDPRLYPGSTLRRIEAAGLRAEHIVLVLIGGEEEEGTTVRAALSHYRTQGFRIALAGITPTRSSLRRMVELHPDYVQMNVGWIHEEAIDSVEESLLQSLISLTRKEQIVLIANGLDREELLPVLISSGMHYGQGEWIGTIRSESLEVAPYVQNRIRTEVNRRYQGASGSLAELTAPVRLFSRDTLVSEISRNFELHREAQGFVIADNGKPIGLLMKEKLHQMLSGQFGLPLYWNRSVGKIMDTHPMIVDESLPVDQVSQMAMAREPDKLYDAVIVTREGQVTGIASIRAMLEWVTQTRMTDAQWANPLTGLPGNERIRREMIRRLADGKPFAVWYADLDHFKWYNDQYGFHKGDDVIRFTGETLVTVARMHESEQCFVGHIGGDDFIVLSSGTDPEMMSQDILQRFVKGIHSFEEQQIGPVFDRSGRQVNDATGLSLSLSVLLCEETAGWTPEKLSQKAALLKKKAKQVNGNSVVWETIAKAESKLSELSDLTLT